MLGVGGAAMVAAQLPREDAGAATGDSFILGQPNDADASTTLTSGAAQPTLGIHNTSGVDGFAVFASATGTGQGLHGVSQFGPGVVGESDSGTGGEFRSNTGRALDVQGEVVVGADIDWAALSVGNTNGGDSASGIVVTNSGKLPAVQADSRFDNGAGVMGVSSSPAGFGDGNGRGVQGVSGSGVGIDGWSTSGMAVLGRSETGRGGAFDSQSASGVSGNSRSGIGVEGHSQTFRAVEGRSEGGEAGVYGESQGGGPGVEGHGFGPTSQGVRGFSDTGVGIFGGCQSGTGVRGQSETSHGVEGVSVGAPAVTGTSQDGTGVLGVSQSTSGGAGVCGIAPGPGPGVLGMAPGEAPGVVAWSGTEPDEGGPGVDGGLALQVLGKARFSTAGAGTIPVGQSSVFVSNPAVSAGSHLTVTLTSDPGPRHLVWVERDPGNGFTVHMSSTRPKDRPETALTYLIVEPG